MGVEKVPATEVQVSDRIFFPNSRKSQAVEQILDDTDRNQSVRTLIAGTARWLVPGPALIRRETED